MSNSFETFDIPQEVSNDEALQVPPATLEPKLDLDAAKKELLDVRTISKIHDQLGRDEVAKTLWDTKHRSQDISSSYEQHATKKDASSQQLAEVLDAERHLEDDVTNRLASLTVKIKSALGLSDRAATELQNHLATVKDEKVKLQSDILQIEEAVNSLKKEQEELPDPKALAEAYYAKMETEPLTNEEKRRLLKSELLASLSMEEYIAVWKRCNPYFLSHVTRQGFRDHNAMMYHSSGLQEFHNGFVGIMEDDRMLRPPLAIQGLKGRDRGSVTAWLENWALQAEDAETAKKRLDAQLHFSLASAPTYPDKTAVHFAAQVVANSYYGGETSNETFFIYPSDALASQHDFAFNGWEKDFTKPQSEMKWNDVFIWPNSLENSGIPIDAGIVFLPNSTLVDKNTGSKYASELVTEEGKEKRVMIEDKALVDAFIGWGTCLNDKGSAVQKAFSEYKEAKYWDKEFMERGLIRTISGELQGLGFGEDAAWSLSSKVFSELYWRQDYNEELLANMVRESGAQWARAKDTVTAKEYWETFFSTNPNLKPKHVVFYDGSPTSAVLEFQQKNGIGIADTSAKEGNLLGFDDHHLLLNKQIGIGDAALNQDTRAMKGHAELLKLATEIIEEHYKTNS